ncbi:MAG: transcriptional regulator TrmB [Candidatus Taylorbacteria bacterium]|nr:transcriptional regulator TrmB [Candidatus Taylorbacteria bacterium]
MEIQNNKLVEKLQKSGFTDKESKVYVAVLELGGAFPSRIAEYTSLNRTTVYHTLLNLSVRGIVNEIEKKNKLFYQAERPGKVIGFAQDQIRMAEDKLNTMKSILPDIEGLYGAFGIRPKITYYEGLDEILGLYREHIRFTEPYEMLAMSNADKLREFFPSDFFDMYVKTKEKIGITTRGILPDTAENRTFNANRYEGIRAEVVPSMRFFNYEQFPSAEITLYGKNRVSIVNFDKKALMGTIIEDDAIYSMMKALFEMSWNSALAKE